VSYTVVGLLGRGGMAVVELAVDGAGRQVARKRVSLHGSAREIELARRRIRREAEILASLHHRGIVPLLEVEDDGADVVLVMPRMASSLADRVATEGPLSRVAVATMGKVLLDALSTAHRQGVIHRDIKPANILFDEAGHAALADFGIAVNRHFTPGLTAAGVVLGTPGFLAPEQARGEPASPASDVFALGATLTFALTGRGPFGEGDPAALMIRAARGQVAPLPKTIPLALRQPLERMLDPRPGRRPTAAAAFGGPSGTRVQPPVRRRRSWKGPAKLTALAALALVAAVVGYTAVRISREPAQAPSAAPAPRAGPSSAAVQPAPTVPVCTPLPFQPCGQAAAPNTDGQSCLPGYADFNQVAADGCEAHSDYQAGVELSARQPVSANLVPADATDTFRTYVADNAWDLCRGKFRVTLAAPAGTTDQVQLMKDGKVIASAVSIEGRAATASANEPSCFQDDSGWVTVVVSSLAGQSSADFRLTRSGSW
jgi:tRNA A-37 threonylcarbamoyl transferase component Bud32